jgi:hypothetical protein
MTTAERVPADGFRESIRVAYGRSWTASLLRRTSIAARHSRLAAAWGWLASTTRHSRLHHWLTTEPDADVISIDLTETYTVGPFVAPLTWTRRAFDLAWPSSLSRRAVDRADAALDVAAASRTARVVDAMLELPEPDDEGEQ